MTIPIGDEDEVFDLIRGAKCWEDFDEEYAKLLDRSDREIARAVLGPLTVGAEAGTRHCPKCFHFYVGPTCYACHLLARSDGVSGASAVSP